MLHREGFTMVSVHHGVRAKTVGQTCTCVTHTCDRCGVKGGRYGVTQSHLQCDLCYTLGIKGCPNLIVAIVLTGKQK